VTFHSFLIVQSYARQLNILTNRTTALGGVFGFDTLGFSRLIADWSVENINHELTSLRGVVGC